ncbi:hypothetical protein O181_114588 [Austropuccinia psidii MF-1]|uniref:Uncharacterized protein n=1 Tax=Austropuccinia psidii MF-1 TaxID=1389203 RepID=A0A9Q3K520_9BASI|nr:hypothetical protein [Austropuccinia psidii MF-1]
MEIDRRRNFRFAEWAPGSGTFDSGNTDSEGTETPTLRISFSELHNEFFSAVLKSDAQQKQCGILPQLLQQKYRSQEMELQAEEPWLRAYKNKKTLPHRWPALPQGKAHQCTHSGRQRPHLSDPARIP